MGRVAGAARAIHYSAMHLLFPLFLIISTSIDLTAGISVSSRHGRNMRFVKRDALSKALLEGRQGVAVIGIAWLLPPLSIY
jgi:hypothetical protein